MHHLNGGPADRAMPGYDPRSGWRRVSGHRMHPAILSSMPFSSRSDYPGAGIRYPFRRFNSFVPRL